MALSAGTRLGSYEIKAQIGSGGMGEVYRARDTRLNRDVAVKLLPDAFAADPDRLRRFELEAQAAGGLNHSNILVVHEIGVDHGRPYMVTELLEGESLRERLRAGKLPLQKAADYARQAATGLAAAHARGIVHRDIKPENLFVMRDGRLKILDFGLAKVTAAPSGDESATQTVATDPGSVLGTLGYMAPEQVRGKEVDPRADIFSLGAVLFEMLTGERAFHGDSAADTMSAILTKDPLEAAPAAVSLAPPLERIVRHCLEKSADERFQSARDLAFDLGSLSGTSAAAVSATGLPAAQPPRRWLRTAILAGLGAAAVAAAFVAGTRTAHPAQPRYERLTYRRGVVQAARFTPGGRSVVFAAAWDGAPLELFTMSLGMPESRPLGLPQSGLFGVSSAGDVMAALGGRFVGSFYFAGTLAQAPAVGGTAREILEDISSADFSTVTGQFAVVPGWKNGQSSRLEYPPGKVLIKGTGTAWQSHIRISPKGDMVAFADHDYFGDDGVVAVVDGTGQKKILTERFTTLQGVAWAPAGDEIWFTGGREGTSRALYGVTLAGKQRLVASAPGTMTLHDIAADGRVLLSHDEFRASVEFVTGDSAPVDLSWLDWSSGYDLSADGKRIVITESGYGVRGVSSAFVRSTDGSPAVKVGASVGGPLSPDGRWVLSRGVTGAAVEPIQLLPVRAGAPRLLELGTVAGLGGRRGWLPDSQRIFFNGNEKGRPQRCFVKSIDGGKPEALTPEGETCLLAFADGSALLTAIGDTPRLHPLQGGTAHALPWKFDPDRAPFQISGDGRWVYVQENERRRATVYRIEMASGKREKWKEITPANTVGVREMSRVSMTPDGKTFAYRVNRDMGELYLVDGLR